MTSTKRCSEDGCHAQATAWVDGLEFCAKHAAGCAAPPKPMSVLEEVKALLESDSGYGLHQLRCITDPESDCSCDSERDASQELQDRTWALIRTMEENAQPCAGGKWLRLFVPDASQDRQEPATDTRKEQRP